jgi:hypothetical protein
MRYVLATIAAFLVVSSVPSTSHAQVSASISINLGSQPIWGPTGYDYVENYYLPDINVYYNVPHHRYYYDNGGRWVSSSSLPTSYHNFDLYGSYKVVVNEPSPWQHPDKYRDQYSTYKGRHDQQPIRDSRDQKYYVIKNHPEHKNWLNEQKRQKQQNQPRKDQQKHDNGNSNGGGSGR